MTGSGRSWKQRTVLLLPVEKAKLNPKLLSAGVDFILMVALELSAECPERIEGHELVCLEPLRLQFSHWHQQKARNALLQIRWMKDFPSPHAINQQMWWGFFVGFYYFCCIELLLLMCHAQRLAEGWAQGTCPPVQEVTSSVILLSYRLPSNVSQVGSAGWAVPAIHCLLTVFLILWFHISVCSLCYGVPNSNTPVPTECHLIPARVSWKPAGLLVA